MPSAAGRGLAELLDLLLADERVQERIAADPELARSWSDPAVRSQVTYAAEAMAGMAQLMDLVNGLLADPAVTARIEADSVLRKLWSDAAVREWLRRTAR